MRVGVGRVAQPLAGQADHLVGDVHPVDFAEVAAQRPHQPSRSAADFERRAASPQALQIHLQRDHDLLAGREELLVVLLAAAEGHVVVCVLPGPLVPVGPHAVEDFLVGHCGCCYSSGLPRISHGRGIPWSRMSAKTRGLTRLSQGAHKLSRKPPVARRRVDSPVCPPVFAPSARTRGLTRPRPKAPQLLAQTPRPIPPRGRRTLSPASSPRPKTPACPARETARQRPVAWACRKSRFMRAMTSSLISLGQTASHSPMLVQPPNLSRPA